MKKKAKVLLIPYAVWGIVIGFLLENGRNLIRGHEFDIASTIAGILTARVAYLASWFLWVLFGVYCVQYLLSAVLMKNGKKVEYIYFGTNVLLLGAGYLLGYFFEGTVFSISLIFVSCFFFVFGVLVRKVVEVLTDRKLWIKSTVAIACIAGGAVCSFLNGKVTYSLEEYSNVIWHTAGACLTTFGLMEAFSLLYEFKGMGWIKRFLEFMGKNSMIVLLTHSLLLYGIRVLEILLGMQIHSFPGLLSFAIILVFQVILIKLIPKKLFWTFGK